MQATGASSIKPLEFFSGAKKNTSQEQGANSVPVGLRIGQRQRGPPRCAGNNPALDIKQGAYLLDIGDLIDHRVVFYAGRRRRTTGPSWVNEHNPITDGIKESGILAARGATGAS